jgi:hypothetical protein
MVFAKKGQNIITLFDGKKALAFRRSIANKSNYYPGWIRGRQPSLNGITSLSLSRLPNPPVPAITVVKTREGLDHQGSIKNLWRVCRARKTLS